VTTSDVDIGERVQAFAAAQLGADADARVDGVTRVATGRSRENWLFDVEWSEGTRRLREPLIARRDPLGGLLETDRATEFALLRALEATDVPAPRPRWLDPTGEALGRPCLVMVREAGTCDYYALGGDAPLAGRLDLARRLCQLLVRVHEVDWARAGLGDGADAALADPGPWASRAAVDGWEAILRGDQLEPYPELELAAAWLRANAPRNERTVLVHGDFKVGNVLLEDGRIVALLDWELAHLGDRHEDLGWITQPLRTREHYIPGAWEREELLGYYEQVSGRPVDRHSVAWWNVLASYKTAVMQVSGLRSYIEGRSEQLYQPTRAVLSSLLDQVAP
jgi:aminoglycoside phosphotransferase (APT) family kinase protein